MSLDLDGLMAELLELYDRLAPGDQAHIEQAAAQVREQFTSVGADPTTDDCRDIFVRLLVASQQPHRLADAGWLGDLAAGACLLARQIEQGAHR